MYTFTVLADEVTAVPLPRCTVQVTANEPAEANVAVLELLVFVFVLEAGLKLTPDEGEEFHVKV